MADGAFHRSVTPPFPLLIATKLIGASCAARVVPELLEDSEGLALALAVGEVDTDGSLLELSDEFFERAKTASTRIPRTTSTSGAGELFFAGALGVEVPMTLGAAVDGVLETGVVVREGTGGI